MKNRATVVGAHAAFVCVVSLVSGCFTPNPDGSVTGAAARTRGPFIHVHPGKDPVVTNPGYTDDDLNPFKVTGDPLLNGGSGIQTTPLEGGGILPPDVKPTPPAVEYDSYIVEPGDILSRLAVRFDTTTARLVSINNLSSPDVIYVGQKLKIPAGRMATSGTGNNNGGGTSNPPKTVPKGGTYEILPGDTLSEIAVQAGVSIDDLRRLNNIEGDMIRAGKELLIPQGGKVPTVTSPTPLTSGGENPNTTKVSGGIEENNGGESAPLTEETTSILIYPVDSLDSLAQEYNTTRDEIMRLNNMTSESDLKVGMSLKVPMP